MEHVAVFHRRVLVSYWEFVTFKMTRLSSTKQLRPSTSLNLSTRLNKLGVDTGNEEMQRIKLQRKLSALLNGEVITQPDACFKLVTLIPM